VTVTDDTTKDRFDDVY